MRTTRNTCANLAKRAMAWLLAAVLLLGAVPSVMVVAQDVPSIVCGEEKQVVTDGGETAFSFVPEEDGAYKFYSYDNAMDTYGYILNVSDGSEVASDDNSGGNGAFAVYAELTAGVTYQLVSRPYYSDSGSYCVKVEPSPIASVEFEPVSFIVETNGYWAWDYDYETGEEFEYYYYTFDPYEHLQYTVTWADGTVTEGEGPYIYSGEDSYSIEVSSEQSYETRWLAGNTYEVPVSVLGLNGSVEVSIEESSIKSIKVEPITVYQDLDSSMTWGYDSIADIEKEYEYYTISEPLELTVEWKDGTVTSCSVIDEMEYDGNTYSVKYRDTQSVVTPWLPNNTYAAEISLMGVKADVSVTVKDSPIRSITLLKASDDAEYLVGEYINSDGVVLRIAYTDGTSEDVTLYRTAELKKFGKTVNYQTGGSTESGMTSYSIRMLNKDVNVPITVIDKAIQSVTIRNDGVNMVMTVTFEDGTTKDMNATGFEPWEFGAGDITWTRGRWYFDGGIFDGTLWENTKTGELSITLNVAHSALKSNELDTSWYDMRREINRIAYAIVSQHNQTPEFKGTVTEENIDDLLSVVCERSRLYQTGDALVSGTDGTYILHGDSVKTAFFKLYGIVPNLTMSHHFNAENNTVAVTIHDAENSDVDSSLRIEETAQGYVVTGRAYVDGKKDDVSFILSEDNQLTAYRYGTPVLIGDVNADGAIDMMDAFAVYAAVSTGAVSEALVATADTNADGTVDMVDAFAIYRIASGA